MVYTHTKSNLTLVDEHIYATCNLGLCTYKPRLYINFYTYPRLTLLDTNI